MDILIWFFVVLNVLLAPVTVYYGRKRFYRGISFSYRVSVSVWFELHFVVYFFALVLMFFVGLLILNMPDDLEKVSVLGKIMIQFVQQGGGVLCVMLLSSVLYKVLLYNGDLDYAMGYSVNMCKIFFSIVCISCACFFWWMGKKEGILGEFVISQIMMWLIVFIQIWIGFGIRCDGRLSEKSKKIDFGGEKKYYMCYLSSMLIPPGVVMLVLLENDRITCWMIAFAVTILIQLVLLLIVVVVCCMISYPTKYGSFIRIVFLLKRLNRKTKVQTSHYRGLKYEAWWENNQLRVRVLGRKVISVSDKFTKAEKQQIENKIRIGDNKKFDNIEGKKQAEVRKILIKHLEEKRNERRELMHGFYEKARKHFEESAQINRKQKVR